MNELHYTQIAFIKQYYLLYLLFPKCLLLLILFNKYCLFLDNALFINSGLELYHNVLIHILQQQGETQAPLSLSTRAFYSLVSVLQYNAILPFFF